MNLARRLQYTPRRTLYWGAGIGALLGALLGFGVGTLVTILLAGLIGVIIGFIIGAVIGLGDEIIFAAALGLLVGGGIGLWQTTGGDLMEPLLSMLLFGSLGAALGALLIILMAQVILPAFGRELREIISPPKQYEAEMQQADRLLEKIFAALKTTRNLQPADKLKLRRLSSDMHNNLAKLYWKLHRLDDLRLILRDEAQRTELDDVRARLITEIEGLRVKLEATPVALAKLDVASGELKIEDLIEELTDANLQIVELAQGYDDVRLLRTNQQ